MRRPELLPARAVHNAVSYTHLDRNGHGTPFEKGEQIPRSPLHAFFDLVHLCSPHSLGAFAFVRPQFLFFLHPPVSGGTKSGPAAFHSAGPENQTICFQEVTCFAPRPRNGRTFFRVRRRQTAKGRYVEDRSCGTASANVQESSLARTSSVISA